jgi:signal transduction histidine kinase
LREKSLRARLDAALVKAGWSVSSPQIEALPEILEQRPVDALVADGWFGDQLSGRLERFPPSTARVLLVGDEQPGEEGAPIRVPLRQAGDGLEDRVLAALERHELRERIRQLEHALEVAGSGAARGTPCEQNARETDWKLICDAIERPIAVLSRGLEVLQANRAYLAIAGKPIEQVLGKRCHRVLFGRESPCEGCQIGRGESPTKVFELSVGERCFSLSGYEAGDRLICVIRETTEERALTGRMVQTEKLAAIGQLAGGVAHEINNPLGGILAFTQLMLRDPGRSEHDLEMLAEIEQAALRCKRIVGSLLELSRRRPAAKTIFDLNALVDDVAVLFRAQLKGRPRAVFHQELSASRLHVVAVAPQIEQVVLTLLANALQALQDGPGSITLRTRGDEHRVEISVTDDGPGIPPETLARIFEPSFSSHSPGEDRGFGLSIAWSIAQSHGGSIEAQSEPGRGSTFTLRLPGAADASLEPEGA